MGSTDNDGCNPLFYAILNWNPEIVKMLLAAGAKRDVPLQFPSGKKGSLDGTKPLEWGNMLVPNDSVQHQAKTEIAILTP